MSTILNENELLQAVRTSSTKLRIQMLNELLSEYVNDKTHWPVPVANSQQEVVAYLFPRPGMSGSRPPELSAEREVEINQRLQDLEHSRELRDYISELDSSGRPS